MKAMFARSMFITLSDTAGRFEVVYVDQNGSHERVKVDAETLEDAIEFVKDKEWCRRIENAYAIFNPKKGFA